MFGVNGVCKLRCRAQKYLVTRLFRFTSSVVLAIFFVKIVGISSLSNSLYPIKNMVDYSKWDHIEVGICVIDVLR